MTPSQTQGLSAVSLLVVALALGGCGKPAEPAVASSAVTPDASAASDPAAAMPPSAMASATGTEPNVSDADVTNHVKTALHSDDVLKAFDISVATLKGDVRLTGVLDTPLQVANAIRIARSSEGVHSIHDELTLKK